MTTTTYLYANAAVFAALGIGQIILLVLMINTHQRYKRLGRLVLHHHRMLCVDAIDCSESEPRATSSTTPVPPSEPPSAGLKGPHCGTGPLTPSSRVGYVPRPSGTSPSSN